MMAVFRQQMPTQSEISSACSGVISVHLPRQQMPTHYSVCVVRLVLLVRSVPETKDLKCTGTKDLELQLPDCPAACCRLLQIRQQMLTLIR